MQCSAVQCCTMVGGKHTKRAASSYQSTGTAATNGCRGQSWDLVVHRSRAAVVKFRDCSGDPD